MQIWKLANDVHEIYCESCFGILLHVLRAVLVSCLILLRLEFDLLKNILIACVCAVVAILVYAATLPDTFIYQRSTIIHASADQAFVLVNDLARCQHGRHLRKLIQT